MAEIKRIRPQEGYQIKALSSSADILIGGGAAGVGKTFVLLLDPIRDINTPNFGAVIFRRTSPQIRNEGGLWDASVKMYSNLSGAKPRETYLEWHMPNNVKIKFSHLQYEKDIYDYQGSEIPFIGFDELTHFTKKMFFYMLTRNRSTCGVKPYIRATCNPDPDSWVAELIDWWIGEDGYPIPERQGVLRYFIVDNDQYIWGDTKEEVIEKGWHALKEAVEKSGIAPSEFVKSITFVGGSIYDNKELLSVDTAYLGNLMAQDEETKDQLLRGNWKMSNNPSDIYNYKSFSDIFTNTHVQGGKKYITTDIAMKGSDKMIVIAWDGKILIDFEVLPKTKGNEVIDAINKMKHKYNVINSRIAFDNDGVGSFVDGFIQGAMEFKNGGKTVNKENYDNLKTQCFYKSGESVDDGEYYVPPEVANRMYDDKMTLRQRLLHERKAVKRDKTDHDGKLKIKPKQEMKVFIGGESPDLIETFMMREVFELVSEPRRRLR